MIWNNFMGPKGQEIASQFKIIFNAFLFSFPFQMIFQALHFLLIFWQLG